MKNELADKEKVGISMEKGFKTIPAAVKPDVFVVVSIFNNVHTF